MSLSSNTSISEDGLLQPEIKPFERPRNLPNRLKSLLVGLDWKQWLVLFATGVAIIAIEIRNHTQMWQAHNSGQTFLTDRELLWEIGAYGLFMPIMVGLILAHLERTAAERNRMARDLAIRRELADQIYRARNWHQLVEVVVAIPGRLVSAERAWLLVQHSDTDEFEPIAHWERFGTAVLPKSAPLSPAVCEQCMASISLNRTRILTCRGSDSACASHENTRHCLWLSTEDARKSALVFDVPLGLDLAPAQLKMLDDLGAELAMAIENASLQYLEQRQVDAARSERQRIARDLHDTLGQNVSYLRLKLEELSSMQLAADQVEFQSELANMLVVADEAYEQVRDALDELRATKHRDLEEAARVYTDQVAARNSFTVRVHSSGQAETLTRRQLRQTMYVLREALNNVEKHAEAQNVDVHLEWHNGECRMTVSDDGRGFCPEEIAKTDSFGMAIMKERARAMNADLVITSLPGSGTEVMLSLPLSARLSVVQNK